MSRILHFAGPLLALLLFLFPECAAADIVVITFDQGFEDPNIVASGPGIHGPFDWLESGVRIAGFWAIDVGTPGSFFEQGHLHP